MPINASPEFEAAWERYTAARTTKEKIEALREAIKYMPKHKGAENLRAFLFRRLAELKRELQKEAERRSGGGGVQLVPKMGFQAVLFGMPNSGKTYILSKITNAPVEPTAYPLATTKPVPGMMDVKGAQVQLVEIPSYFEGYEDSKMGRIGLATMRATDAIILVVDLTQDPAEQLTALVRFLQSEDIYLNRRPPRVKVEKKYSGGFEFIGKSLMEGDEKTYIDILQTYGIHSATVTFLEKTTPEDFILAINESARFLPAVIVGNKGEQAPQKNIDVLKSVKNVPVLFFENGKEEAFKEQLFDALGLIRVYTKPPRGKPSPQPVVLKRGDTVADLSRIVLQGKEAKAARIWGSARFPGQMVGADYVLQDGDIVELRL